MQAILRRTASELPGDVLRFADLTLDEARHEVFRGETLRRADRDRVRAAPLLPAEPAPRALEGADPAERLAVRLRRQLERGRDLRQLPAQEARRARPAADPDDPAGRLHARTAGSRCSAGCRCARGWSLGVFVARRRRPRRSRTSRPTRRSARSCSTASTRRSRPGTSRSSGMALRRPRSGPGRGRRPDPRGDPGRPAQGVDWYQVRTLVRARRPERVPRRRRLAAEARRRDPAPGGEQPRPAERVAYFTVSSANGSTSYRVRASIEPQQPNASSLIATSLHDVFGTLHRLLLIEMLVTLAVLGGIAGARPLGGPARAASAA